jgi:hypothetical protein
VVDVLPGEGAVVEAPVTRVQGIFGVGGEAYGPIVVACAQATEPLTDRDLRPEMRGAIILGGARATSAAIARAVEIGASAIVTGGIDDLDLRNLLGFDLGVATTGSEAVGLTLIVTEGFGEIAMAGRTFALLASRAGALAAVNGATQIRAGVVRPEVVIPWPDDSPPSPAETPRETPAGVLRAGTSVRIIRDPYFGIIGTISGLPGEPRVLGSGSLARVLEVSLADGATVVVPRANVELIEG